MGVTGADDPLIKAREEMRDLLRDIPHWRLTDDGWGQVEQRLADAAEATVTADPGLLAQAVAEVGITAPRRGRVRLGDTPAMPAPSSVRERVNKLVHRLDILEARERGDHGRTPGAG